MLYSSNVWYRIDICVHYWFLRMEQLGSYRNDFNEISYKSILRKSIEKIQVTLKSDKNNRHITWRPIYIFDHISLIYSYNEKCFRQTLYKKSKHTFCVQWLFFENLAVCEIMWKNIVERDRIQMAIWRMRVACWITITGTLHADRYTFLITSRSVLLTMRNVSDKSCRENQNTHFVFSDFFPKIVPFIR